MKILKITLTYPYSYIAIFVLLMNSYMYAQSLSINPSFQSIAVESGSQNSAYVNLLNESNQYSINYKVVLAYPSSPYAGLINVNPSLDQNLSLSPNGNKSFKFTFSENVTGDTFTRVYKFRVVWTVQDGFNNEVTSDITINVAYLSNVNCSGLPPQIRYASNILSTSAVTGWDSLPYASGYKVRVKDVLTGIYYTSPAITRTFYQWNNLISGRSYYFEVKTLCSDGSESYWSPANTSVFTTQPSGCHSGASIGLPISTSQDIRVSGTIYASSVVYQNLNVGFKASQIILKPGFSVSGHSTGVFRAHIDPCTPGSSKTEEPLSEFAIKKEMEVQPILSPNPTKTVLNVDNIADINEWKLVDINGKIVESGRINNSVQTKITINTSRLIPGVYYFNAVMKNGELFQKTVMKK